MIVLCVWKTLLKSTVLKKKIVCTKKINYKIVKKKRDIEINKIWIDCLSDIFACYGCVCSVMVIGTEDGISSHQLIYSTLMLLKKVWRYTFFPTKLWVKYQDRISMAFLVLGVS